MFATSSPAVKFKFEVGGALAPPGKTLRYPPALSPVAVTFSTTALVELAGTPSMPAT
jgi:hypothetical protein